MLRGSLWHVHARDHCANSARRCLQKLKSILIRLVSSAGTGCVFALCRLCRRRGLCGARAYGSLGSVCVPPCPPAAPRFSFFYATRKNPTTVQHKIAFMKVRRSGGVGDLRRRGHRHRSAAPRAAVRPRRPPARAVHGGEDAQGPRRTTGWQVGSDVSAALAARCRAKAIDARARAVVCAALEPANGALGTCLLLIGASRLQ